MINIGIEKSKPLINMFLKDIVLLGTEFMECNLIDKQTDIIFCNPPYSEYVDWIVKIIKESYCKIDKLISNNS